MTIPAMAPPERPEEVAAASPPTSGVVEGVAEGEGPSGGVPPGGVPSGVDPAGGVMGGGCVGGGLVDVGVGRGGRGLGAFEGVGASDGGCGGGGRGLGSVCVSGNGITEAWRATGRATGRALVRVKNVSAATRTAARHEVLAIGLRVWRVRVRVRGRKDGIREIARCVEFGWQAFCNWNTVGMRMKFVMEAEVAEVAEVGADVRIR